MGKQGKETPVPIIEFIIREKRDAPGLTQAQLAARVEGKFGQTIDKSTVGRYLRKNRDQIAQGDHSEDAAGTFERSQESASHRRELYYFGQRLRDRLEFLAPHQALNQWRGTSEDAELPLWSGRPAIPLRDPVEMTEEEWNVEEGWKTGPCNAQLHPQFPFFREHLAGGSLWKDFDRLEGQVREYFQACGAAFTKTAGKVEMNLPGLLEVDVHSVAMSLLASASGGALTQSTASDFSYPVQEEMTGEDASWTLQLGAWIIRSRNHDELDHLIDVHKNLLENASQWQEVLFMCRLQLACHDTILAIQEALTPDAKLRGLIRDGGCSICPHRR